MAGDFGLGLNLAHDGLDYYRNCMCSIPGGEPESLENDDQLDPEVASYGPSTGPALFLCCCWILIHLIAYILLLKESKFLNL